MTFRNVNTFTEYSILAQDGEIGKVDALLFDDISWRIQYFVVNTGSWLKRQKVLLSPQAVKQTDPDAKQFHVNLTKEQVENSPDIDADKPVSLQHQIQLHDYYAWNYYWNMQGFYPVTPMIPPQAMQEDYRKLLEEDEKKGDPHLRSTKEVIGYHIRATDDEIGHVEDFLVEDEGWAIQYMVVDTRNWLPGRKVLISPRWITWVEWLERKVHVCITKEAVQESPEYNPSTDISRKYETDLFEHYGLPFYWLPR